MSKRIETGIADVPNVGRVSYQVQETRLANGSVAVRVLQSARYLDSNRPVSDDEHRARIARYVNAV